MARAATSGASGCLEGATDHVVHDPDSGKIITDIDLFENDVMWELKSAIYADDVWPAKHVDLKLANYLKCRKLLLGYENAPIGFRFTTSGMDPRFRTALQERFKELRKTYPDLDLRLEIAD
ncbi:hypothetical protein [Streptomyces sp. NPDC056660]|uniref:hypothetical protein n=1 Tax=Streptomyces sp. NPDC056660 TaxID=3345897 RepID=UPI0036859442